MAPSASARGTLSEAALDGALRGRVATLLVGSPGEPAESAWLAGTAPPTLVGVSGLAADDLRDGTRLRIGSASLELIAGDPGPGAVALLIQGAPGGRPRRAAVVAPGTIRIGEPVTIDAVPLPLEDSLDLHSFRPEETADVVREYLGLARAAGFREVRIVHGRGRGVQRETVRRVLGGSAEVAGFADAPPERGGWGATVVRLADRPRPPPT